MMTQYPPLVIEYFGGPRDGYRSTLLRSMPKQPVQYPLEIKAFSYKDGVERQVGRYVRDHMVDDDHAMRYLWTSTIE